LALLTRLSRLIRRLVRAVRRGPIEALAQVGPPEQFVSTRPGPTMWVQDGYTAVAPIASLETGFRDAEVVPSVCQTCRTGRWREAIAW